MANRIDTNELMDTPIVAAMKAIGINLNKNIADRKLKAMMLRRVGIHPVFVATEAGFLPNKNLTTMRIC